MAIRNEHEITSTTVKRRFGQQFPIWRSKRVWGMLGEDVGSRGRFFLLQNLPLLPTSPWMGLRRSSTGIPHTLKSAKLLKLRIAEVRWLD